MLYLFVGAPQSKYAALAILAAVIIVSLTMLFGKDPIPLSQKFALVLLIFLMSLPGILLTLFQLTCLVTGAGFRNQRPWCAWYSWILSGLLILYCVFLIVIAVLALATGEKVLTEVNTMETENFESKMKKANSDAVQFFVGKKSDVDVPVVEKKEAFKVQGGASVPAPIEQEPVVVAPAVMEAPAVAPAVAPEAFEDADGFTSCGSPY